ncbi:hypothetical protein PINS_up000827 [Pythium insidiosum]|nr:hypothetical protein PINS_up000827 [Pythium insidiosum]
MTEPLAAPSMQTRPRRVTYTQGEPSVASDSILAGSRVGAAPPPPPPSHTDTNGLTTSYLTRLAHDLLGSSENGGAPATAVRTVLHYDDGAMGSRVSPPPVIGEHALDLSPVQYEGQTPDNLVALMPPPIALDTISTLSPRRGGRGAGGGGGVRRVRLDSSTVSSTQDVLENHSPSSSDAAYMTLRRTLEVDPTTAPPFVSNVVASSLRPVRDPFPSNQHHNQQRRMTATQHLATQERDAEHQRARRGTAVWLQNDPRGTFRTYSPETARQIFAAQHVRLHDRWLTDVWIYMYANLVH